MKHQLNDIAEISGLDFQHIADLVMWAGEKHWEPSECWFRTNGETHELHAYGEAICISSTGRYVCKNTWVSESEWEWEEV
jgi:hypothetical protein